MDGSDSGEPSLLVINKAIDTKLLFCVVNSTLTLLVDKDYLIYGTKGIIIFTPWLGIKSLLLPQQ